ncbi:DoxX-like family protein [Sphingobacterium corticibacter]|uniref:DoxX family protein n=1 Tax=Sphingobacterium corticibacter TaxID=2171749 RepID=A0A2T8HN98_9SPHI|nr:DoxX-like family protein [Sphingobacterium corticibacter]PVH26906.1 hypothetical protein DC487_04740 [Sphingobacterium corticibacter]
MNTEIKQSLHTILTYLLTAVWLVNGLFCKVLKLVPRHEEIVATILGATYARELTLMIGCAEILMAIWIFSGLLSRFNAITQISIVMLMNVLEMILVPHLLLWGYMNLVFALLFCALIYYWEFTLNYGLKRKSKC